MKEKEYYDIMCNMDYKMSFEELNKLWYKCFTYILKSFKVGFNKKSIKSLYYDFDMDNWTALHKDQTEYKDYSKKKLIKAFCGECHYICDRASYDRLFRTHWLFRQAFDHELNILRFPDSYK